MFLFIIDIIRDLTYILLSAFIVTNLCLIDSGGQVGGIPFVFVPLFLFIFSGLIKRFVILSDDRHGNLSLRSAPAMIFYRSLSLNFVCGSICWLTSLEDLLIGFMYVRTQL